MSLSVKTLSIWVNGNLIKAKVCGMYSVEGPGGEMFYFDPVTSKWKSELDRDGYKPKSAGKEGDFEDMGNGVMGQWRNGRLIPVSKVTNPKNMGNVAKNHGSSATRIG